MSSSGCRTDTFIIVLTPCCPSIVPLSRSFVCAANASVPSAQRVVQCQALRRSALSTSAKVEIRTAPSLNRAMMCSSPPMAST